jgi:probable HAF family extracellular repeat protein
VLDSLRAARFRECKQVLVVRFNDKKKIRGSRAKRLQLSSACTIFRRAQEAAMPRFSPIDLGPHSNQSSDIGAAINLQGDVVASSGQSVSAQGRAPAFRTAAGRMRQLDLPPGDAFSEAYGVNSAGIVVGTSTLGERNRAVNWRNGRLRPLSTPPEATSSGALGINSAGEVVGYVVMGDVSIASIWIGDDWFPLPTLAGAERQGSIARAINNRGDVVGVAYSSQGGRAFLWREQTGAIDLGTLGGDWSDAKSVNEKGEIAGVSGVSGGAEQRAFRWSERDGMIDLGTLPGGTRSYALAINNRGNVVGFSDTDDNRFAAVLWDRDQCIDLSAQVPPGWLLAEALAINDAGTIVCRSHGRMVLLHQ